MMETGKIRIFVSSVQKELENERLAVSELIALDPFLNRHVEAILFEMLPASAVSAESAYLEALRSCGIYFGIIGFDYGCKGSDELSATHREYLGAIGLRRPEFQSKDGHFKVIFFAPVNIQKLKSQSLKPVFEVPENLLAGLSKTQRAIIQHQIHQHTVKVPELAKALNLTPQAIRKAIRLLLEFGLVTREGKARGTTYSLQEDIE